MGLFNKLLGLPGKDEKRYSQAVFGSTDEDFDVYLKFNMLNPELKASKEEQGNENLNDLNRKLKEAYKHKSAKSAFWWYENCKIKPNTGHMEDTLLLHNKFRQSLNSVSIEELERFIFLVLPDIDYKLKGAGAFKFEGKADCAKDIISEYMKATEKKP